VDAAEDYWFNCDRLNLNRVGNNILYLCRPSNATGNFTKIVKRVPIKIVFDRESTLGYESRLVAGLSVESSVDLISVTKGQALPQNQQILKDQQSHLQASATQP
jgi:membrane fusion protein (multidrug efflux system)